jgi:Translation initiation factor IF-2, N-terminal region
MVEPENLHRVDLPGDVTSLELADLLGVEVTSVITELFRRGHIVTVNQVLGYQLAAEVANAFGYDARLRTN